MLRYFWGYCTLIFKNLLKSLKYLFCGKTCKITGKELKPLQKFNLLVKLIAQKKIHVIKCLSIKQNIYFTEQTWEVLSQSGKEIWPVYVILQNNVWSAIKNMAWTIVNFT